MMKAVEIDALLGARAVPSVETGDEGTPFGDVLEQQVLQLEPADSAPVRVPETGLVPVAFSDSTEVILPEVDGAAPAITLASVLPEELLTSLQGGNESPIGGTGLPDGELSLVPMALQMPDVPVTDLQIEPLTSDGTDIALSMIVQQGEVSSDSVSGSGSVSGMTLPMKHGSAEVDLTAEMTLAQSMGAAGIAGGSMTEVQSNLLIAEATTKAGVNDSVSRSVVASTQIQSVIDPRRQLGSLSSDVAIRLDGRAGAEGIQSSGAIDGGRPQFTVVSAQEPVMATLTSTEMFAAAQTRNETQPIVNQGVANQFVSEQSLPDLKPLTSAIATAVQQPATASVEQQSSLIRPVHTLTTPAQQPGWDQEFGNRINYMIKHDQQVAELRLNPASLGVVEVRISTENDKAEVTFFAQNAATREMLETALPKLRETLAANGVELEQAQVSGDALPDRQSERQVAGGNRSTSGNVSDGVIEAEPEEAARVISANTLVDTYI